MEYVMLGLLVFAIFIFILSFFQKDHFQLMREELEQFTLQQMQENYQVKKKLKVLEEELLFNEEEIGPFASPRNNDKQTVHEIIKNQVLSLAQQGSNVEQISKQSSLSYEEVRSILIEHGMWGGGSE